MDLEAQGIDGLELENEIVTVSMLQMALRAEARRVQTVLNDLGIHADTATPEGLFELLQQIARVLLDYSSEWTHVCASSRTVNGLDTADELYARLSLQERSKFSVETLTNVDGVVRQRPAIAPGSLGEPAYIVVTLLLGTADDHPLFKEIYSASVLRDVLEDIRMMQPRYLLVFEVLWTPQDPSDSLTEADLTAEYPEMVAIG